MSLSQQTHHVDSTLKRRRNGRFHVVSTWNPRGVFVRILLLFLEKLENGIKTSFKKVKLFK